MYLKISIDIHYYALYVYLQIYLDIHYVILIPPECIPWDTSVPSLKLKTPWKPWSLTLSDACVVIFSLFVCDRCTRGGGAGDSSQMANSLAWCPPTPTEPAQGSPSSDRYLHCLKNHFFWTAVSTSFVIDLCHVCEKCPWLITK